MKRLVAISALSICAFSSIAVGDDYSNEKDCTENIYEKFRSAPGYQSSTDSTGKRYVNVTSHYNRKDQACYIKIEENFYIKNSPPSFFTYLKNGISEELMAHANSSKMTGGIFDRNYNKGFMCNIFFKCDSYINAIDYINEKMGR
jgi:hypothetical protein